jgi:hypothetical protein
MVGNMKSITYQEIKPRLRKVEKYNPKVEMLLPEFLGAV